MAAAVDDPDYVKILSTFPRRRGDTAQKSKEQIEKLLNEGVNINARNRLGRTPLMAAYVGGNYELAMMLLDLGANPTIVDTILGEPLDKLVKKDLETSKNPRTSDKELYAKIITRREGMKTFVKDPRLPTDVSRKIAEFAYGRRGGRKHRTRKTKRRQTRRRR